MTIDFNKTPFFDDYDETKNFHRILYRPAYAVQARELTQQQTILQNQIARFGNHIFKNGSMVIPGQITFDDKYHFTKIDTTYDGVNVVLSNFVGYSVTGLTSGITAEVVNGVDVEGTDPKTLYVKYLNSGSGGQATFQDGEILQRVDNPIYLCKVQGTTEVVSFASSGVGSASSIENGVYYINGFFINVYKQTIILSKYSSTPTAKIGLKLYERTITPEDDITLNDNAIGSYNYAAPGAYRYKLDLLLEYIDVDADIPEDFIELQRIEGGTVINEIRTTEYNELEKTFARRTYDESGDYTVTPFNINIIEHLKDPLIPRFAEGKYLASDTPAGDESKLVIGIEPGKAYVRGYERWNLSTVWLPTNKARTFSVSNNSITNFSVGNYIYVKQVFKLPDWSLFSKVNLWSSVPGGGDGNVPAGSPIGTARVRSIELVDNTGLTADLYVYKLYLFDIQLNAGVAWTSVLWISDSDSAAQFTCNPTVGGDYADVDNMIINPTKKSSIFKLPHQYIKTLKPSGSNDTTYTVNRVYTSVAVTGGTIDIDTGVNTVPNVFTGRNYVIMDLAAVTSATAFIEVTDTDFSYSGSVVTISGLGAVASVRVSVPVVKTISTERTKTLMNQVYNITSPNKTQGAFDILDRGDGYRLISVIDAGASNLDITNRYSFDNGQRESHYDRARIQLLSGYAPPVGPITVTYSYFSHTNGDFCSVDSYYSLDYYEIPAFYSEMGQFDLADCIDFRPVMNAAGTGFSGTGGRTCEMPVALSNIHVDYEHYLSRIDKLYIDYMGRFGIVEGTPAVYPSPPKSPSDGMVLYEIFMTAYTYSPTNAKPKFIDNKRYTMRDIGRLETRINNLEYYTTLSLLEKETAQMQIKDENGLERFKNGFIVESFKSHGIGDSLNQDYNCSIDAQFEQMRPSFNSESIKLEFNEADSSDVQQSGPLITLPYTSVPFISQGLASMTENVNPFAVRVFEGKVFFQPDSDNWYDTKKNGNLIVNDDAHFQALEFIATNGDGLNGISWNDWETIWASSSTSKSSKTSTIIDRSRPHDTGQVKKVTTSSISTTTTSKLKKTGTKTTFSEQTVNKFLGDRTVGINYIPYMRSISLLIKVEAMRPSTVVYPFFDDIAVTAHCTPAIKVAISARSKAFLTKVGSEEFVTSPGGGKAVIVFDSFDADTKEVTLVNWNGLGFTSGQTITGAKSGATAVLSANAVATVKGGQLKTDAKGRLALIFLTPNNNTLRFRTGERKFILNDQINNVEANQTRAEGTFKSLGSMLQQEGTILSTKTIKFNQTPLSQTKTTTSTTTSTTTAETKWYDPLAQTFLIQEPGGCFITSCTLYFQKKDTKLPLSFQIREVVNGYPGQRIVPYSEVTVYPEDINVSLNGATPTTIEMQAPVFLQQGTEYCFVLLSDSFEYHVWIAQMGQLDIITKQMISKQPYNGVLFKSQNASTWTANQDQDLKFTLNKARFKIETTEGSGVPLQGIVKFNNEELSLELLDQNPIETFDGSTTVRVHQPNHGFTSGSKVTLSGFEALTTYNGVPESELNATHLIDKVELDSYTITVTTAATDSGITGGETVYASRNIQMDVMRPNIAEIVLPDTSSEWGARTVTHQSINGDQTPYTYVPSLIGTYEGISIEENTFLSTSRMICSADNETYKLAGAKSLEFVNYIGSSNRNISPVIDTNRCSVIAVGNKIDNHTPVTADFTASTTNTEFTVSIAHASHGMTTGAVVSIVADAPIGGIPALNLTGDFVITRIDDDTYNIVSSVAATSTANATVHVTYCNTQYKFVPENISQGGSASAKYQTRQITVEEPAIAVKIFVTAMVMYGSTMEIWYKKQGPYDTSLFSEIEWSLLEDPDTFVPLSENEEDFREYEFTKEFAADEDFTSIAIKIVMKSTDSTIVPVVDDLRIICLGT